MTEVFIGDFSLYQLVLYFFVYAFFGWCAEVVFAAVKNGAFVNRGFLNGPVCPIYGVGVVVVLLALTPLADMFWVVFVCSLLLCSFIEWATGFVLEKFFHRKWWDYSKMPFNVGGYVCPAMSLLWGFACLVVVYAVHPAIGGLIDLLPVVAGYVMMGIAAALFVTDLVFTVLQITKLGRQIKEIEEINKKMRAGSDALGSAISALTVRSAEKLAPIVEKGGKVKSDLKTKYEKTKKELEEKIAGSRLGKAFPHIHKRGAGKDERPSDADKNEKDDENKDDRSEK